MPFWRFTVLTLLGCIPWVLMLALIGQAVGDNWEEWRDHLHYLDYASSRRSSAWSSTCWSGAGAAAGQGDEEPRSGAGAGRLERRLSEPADGRIPARRALALGIVQGPAELLPVSSSAHIVLVPWLAGWDWEAIDPEVRKSFEVALHAGAAAALLIGQRRADRRRAARLRRCAARSSSASPSCPPRSSATRSSGRSSGGWADRGRPRSGCSPARRRCSSPTHGRSGAAAARRAPADGLALGVAQAAALAPGVSRNGITLAAARWRRLLPRPGEPALAHDRPADHRRRHRAQGRAPAPPRRLARAAPLDGDRRRRLLRLDPRLPAPDRPGRARPGAVALRGLPAAPRRRGSCEAAARP